MMNMPLFLALMFLFTFLVGRLLERLRIPWIFAALLLGVLLAINNPFSVLTDSQTFVFLAQLGMYFLLFMIGFELDLDQMKQSSRFIFQATFFIILLEAIFGTLLIYFVFGYDLIISSLVALSFATVGEAILVPILDEFRAVNTKLGQAIIGIGTLDDAIELLVLILVVLMLGTGGVTAAHIATILMALAVLFLLTYSLIWLKKRGQRFAFFGMETLFLFALFVLFLFIGIGEYAHVGALAALLAGVGLRSFVPKVRMALIETELKAVCYGLFAPLFFVWVGLTMDMHYLLAYPLLILLVVTVSNGAKLLGSYIVARRELGGRQSILLGIGLSVRFSTSIVVVKLLFEHKLIDVDLYSVVVASSIAFKFIVPLLFARLLVRWQVVKPLSYDRSL